MLSLVLSLTIGLLLGILIGWLITVRTRHRLKRNVRFFQALTTQIPTGLFYQDLTSYNY